MPMGELESYLRQLDSMVQILSGGHVKLQERDDPPGG